MFVFFVQSILQNQKYFQFQIIWKQTKASYSYIRLFKDLNCFIFWQNWSISLLCERWKTWAFVLFYWEKKENYTICGLSLQTRKRSGNLFLHFPINSVEFPWRRCSEYCSLKIDPLSRSCPLPSGELVIYVDHSRPGNNLPASVSIRASLFSPSHTYCTVYEVLSPVQSAEWRLLPLTPPGKVLPSQPNHNADL